MLTESNKCQYHGVKIYAKFAGNNMLMISPLNWIKPILSSSKEEYVLVLLKCQDLFIGFPYQSLFKQWPVLKLQNYSSHLNIGQGQLNIALIM